MMIIITPLSSSARAARRRDLAAHRFHDDFHNNDHYHDFHNDYEHDAAVFIGEGGAGAARQHTDFIMIFMMMIILDAYERDAAVFVGEGGAQARRGSTPISY